MDKILFIFFIALLPFTGTKSPAQVKNGSFSDHQETRTSVALAIHGGAGTITRKSMDAKTEAAYRAKLLEALDAGFAVLEQGGPALEAVTASVKILEDSPLFNAGKGSVFTHEGKNEMDAAIMDGATKNAGAVASLTRVKNPVSAAYAVMKNSPHVFLAGAGAEQFAEEQELEMVDPSYFWDQRRYEQLMKVIEAEKQTKAGTPLQQPPLMDPAFSDNKFGTVGAVAVDRKGNVAAATSTGGMTNKRFGRIGDVPVIGAGTYADNATCAVSATGHGEYFIRGVVAHEIAAQMKYAGRTLHEAAEDVVLNQLAALKGEGGVIAIDSQGNIAMPFNSAGMYRAYIRKKGQGKTFIFKDENEGLK